MKMKNDYSIAIAFALIIISYNTYLLWGQQSMKPLHVTSSSFDANQPIPKKYSGEDKDISPQLSWSGAPDNTKSYAIIVDDPDAPAGTWVHWVVFNLPATVTTLKEGADIASLGGIVGKNSFPTNKYNGPMPPAGKPHRYFFKIYALDIPTLEGLNKNATKDDVMKAINGHIIAQQDEFLGTYQRK